MTLPIKRVGVVGAGQMGCGIAAHLANAGIPVVLLDIVPPNLTDAQKKDPKQRNAFAAGGLEKALKTKPAPFFHPTHARLITIGNTEDDLARLAGCDLVIESIIENLGAKQALFEKLEKVLTEKTIVASNTSGLPIKQMVAGRSEGFQKRFMVMHFFNPVRYLKLLELVPGEKTDPAVLERVRSLGSDSLGKGIVVGKDTPNFIGNRIGTHALATVVHDLATGELTSEEIDQIAGKPMGHPKSAVLGTCDMVGLDTLIHVFDGSYAALVNDPEREMFKVPAFFRTMFEKKLLGRKTGGGFYRKTKEGFETYDPKKGDYVAQKVDPEIKKTCKELSKIDDVRARVKALVEDKGRAGTYGWKLLARSLSYSACTAAEIADDVESIDNAMKWGFNWDLGPFESWDAVGFKAAYDRMKADGYELPAWVDKMAAQGATGFYRDDGAMYDFKAGDYLKPDKGEHSRRTIDKRYATLPKLRKGKTVAWQNDGLEAWDIGDGILCVSFKTKANSLDNDVIAGLNATLDLAESDFRGMLLYNEGEHFSVGANLFAVVMAANQKQWEDIRSTVTKLQATVQRMKYSPIPVIGAPFGMTLGGGLEICLACDAIQAYAETYTGLVEVGVGLIPGGGGNMNLLWRALEGIPDGANVDTQAIVARVFENIAMARVATSAVEAQHFGYFKRAAGVTYDKARHLSEAKSRLIGLAAAGYHPPVPRAFRLPGESGIATIKMMVGTLVAGGFASEHDALIAGKLANVLCGGAGGNTHEVTEDEILELEAEAFVSLCGEPKSLERMQYMLMNNKPLRN